MYYSLRMRQRVKSPLIPWLLVFALMMGMFYLLDHVDVFYDLSTPIVELMK